MCWYFCIEFNEFMLKSKSITGFINLFLPNNFKKNDDIILSYIEIGINEINKLN